MFFLLISLQLLNRNIHATAAAVFYMLACINTAFGCNESWVKRFYSLLSGIGAAPIKNHKTGSNWVGDRSDT